MALVWSRPMQDDHAEALRRTFLCCLLYRLGGEQTFTPEEIQEIRLCVSRVQIIATHDNKIVLRTRGPESPPEMLGTGVLL